MIKISKQLQAPKGMQLGYASTESLVAMIKTPNNTFPVYWCECKENSHAPFVRKGNIKVIGSEKIILIDDERKLINKLLNLSGLEINNYIKKLLNGIRFV